jgi:hypothetical protein
MEGRLGITTSVVRVIPVQQGHMCKLISSILTTIMEE